MYLSPHSAVYDQQSYTWRPITNKLSAAHNSRNAGSSADPTWWRGEKATHNAVYKNPKPSTSAPQQQPHPPHPSPHQNAETKHPLRPRRLAHPRRLQPPHNAALNPRLPHNLLSLPSVDAPPGLSDFTADVTALTSLINTHLSDNEDLVLLLWSYGSVPGSEAVVPSMLKPARAQAGLSGGVVHIIYLAAPILPIGASIEKSRPGEQIGNADVAMYSESPGTVAINPAFAKAVFYSDVEDPAVLQRLVEGLLPISVGPLRSKLTRAAWMYTPATVVICEKDLGLPVERHEEQLRAARGLAPGCFEKVLRCGASHVPFVSMPEWVVGVLRGVVGEEGAGVVN